MREPCHPELFNYFKFLRFNRQKPAHGKNSAGGARDYRSGNFCPGTSLAYIKGMSGRDSAGGRLLIKQTDKAF